MRLHLNKTLRTALIAAISTVGLTLTQAQAEDSNLALFDLNSSILEGHAGATSVDITQGSVTLTVATSWASGLGSGTNSYTEANVVGATIAQMDENAMLPQGSSMASTLGTFVSAGAKNGGADLTITLSGLNAGDTYNVSVTSGLDFEGAGSWTVFGTQNAHGTVTGADLGTQNVQVRNVSAWAIEDMVADASGCITFSVDCLGSHTAVINGIAIAGPAYVPPTILTWAGTEQDHKLTSSVWNNGQTTTAEYSETMPLHFGADGWKEVIVDSAATAQSVTVDGAAYTFSLTGDGSLTTNQIAVKGDGASLTIDGTGTVTAGSIAAEGKTISLDEGVVLKGVSSGKGTLDGSGKYELKSGVDTMGGMAFADTWTGTVKLSNITTQQLDLNNYGTAKSVVEIDGWSKFLKNSNGYVYNPKLRLTGSGMTIQDGYSNYSYVFAGGVEGEGDFKIGITTSANNQTYAFTGDLSHWTGAYESQKDKTSTIKFYGSATEIGAAIKQTAGTINIEVGDGTTAFSTVFDQAVTATTLDIKDKAIATFKNDATIGSITSTGTLKVDADTHTVTLNGGTLDNTIAVQAGTLQLNGTFDITGNIGEMSATYSDGDNGFKTTQGTITVYTKEAGAEVTIVDGTQFIYDETPVELTIDGTYEAPAHTDNTTYYVNKGTANFTSALAQEDMEHIVMSNYTELNVDADGTLSTLTADGSVQLTNEGGERRSLTLGSVEGESDVAVTGAIDVTIAGTITGTRDLTAMRLIHGATVHVTMGTGNAEILNLGSSDGSSTVVLEGGNLSYRSNLEDYTLQLKEGSTLLFGQAGDDTNHTYAGNIEVEGDANVKTFGTSQHPSATISGDVRGGGTLTRVNDGNQTLTFTGEVELYGYTNNDAQGGNLTDFLGSTRIEELTVGNSSNTKFSNEDTTIGAIVVNGSGSVEFAHDYTLENVSTTGGHALTLKAAEGVTITLGDGIELHKLVAGGAGNLVVAEGTTLSLENNLTPLSGTVDVYGTVNVESDLDLSSNGASTATLSLKGGSETTAAGMWMASGASLLMEEGAVLNIGGLQIVGTGDGGIDTEAANEKYGTGKAAFSITNATVTSTGTNVTLGNTLSGVDVFVAEGSSLTLNTAADSVTVNAGGTINKGEGGSITNLTVEDGGIVGSGVETSEAMIADGATATYAEGLDDSDSAVVFIAGDDVEVQVTNNSGQAAAYDGIGNENMKVTAGTMRSVSTEDIVVYNSLVVDSVVNYHMAGALTINTIDTDTLSSIENMGGQVTLMNIGTDPIELADVTIAADSIVALYQDATVAPEQEATVTIAAEGVLTAGGGTLLANLEMADGSAMVLYGETVTLGSQFTIADNALVTLDEETLAAIAGLVNIGDKVILINQYEDHALTTNLTDGDWARTHFDLSSITGADFTMYVQEGQIGIMKSSNVPEPTTGTLSLLALAALAARRRKH